MESFKQITRKKKEKRELKRVKVKVKVMSMMVNNTIRPVPFPVSKPREYTSLYYKIKKKRAVNYHDKWGPSVLCLGLVISVAISFGYRFTHGGEGGLKGSS